MSKKPMLDVKLWSVENLKRRKGELPQRRALKMRRGKKQTQPHEM
jgi:hypothetical protein